MTLAVPFIRSVRLEVGPNQELTIDKLRTSFQIHKDIEGNPSPSTISVYNLAETTFSNIREKWTRFRLFAGYGESPGLVVDGQSKHVEQVPQDTDRVTLITLGGSEREKVLSNFQGSYEGEVALATVLADIVRSMMLEVGRLEQVPRVTLRDFVWTGSARQALYKLTSSYGLVWYEDNRVIHFEAVRSVAGEASLGAFNLHREAGMIGSPTRTEKGAKAEMVLNTDLQLGHVVNIESILLTGSLRVIKLSHIGDSWDGKFVTAFEGVSIGN